MFHSVALIITVIAILIPGFTEASLHEARPPRRAGHHHRRHHAQLANSTLDVSLTHRSLVERAAPSGWNLFVKSGNDGGGCYIDSSSARLLTGYSANSANNGLQSCLSACQDRGFTYGGVQYGSECYCGNSVPANMASAPSSQCNVACRTTSTDKCGGNYRMNVYSFTSTSPPDLGGYSLQGCVADGNARALTGYTFTSGRMTAKLCVDECSNRGFSMAGVEYGQECYCGNSLSNGLGQSLDSSRCNRNCIGDGGSNCGGEWSLSLYTRASTTTPPGTPSGWSYNGCTLDTNNNRVLNFQSSSGSMSISTCLANCARLGAKYAGVEYGQECYCGNTLNGGSRLDEARCNSRCGSGQTAGCGGSWALSVYQSSSPSTPSPSPSPSPPSSSSAPSGWTYVQCGTDADQRALTGSTFVDATGMTINKCLSFCASGGFKIGGVEVGAECWCGNSLQNNQGKKVADGECSSACRGDGATGRCGGDWRISFFSTLTGSALSSAFGSSTTTTTTTTTTAGTTPTSTPNQPGSYTPTIPIPGSGTKYVWAHFIMGNAYPYNYNTWMSDIRLASANGIDGFMLNLGPDSWQPDRVKDAYNAAAASGTGFKMMLSFDLAEFDCGGTSRIGLFQQYLRDFLYHAAAAKVNGKQAVTTFMGQDCSFGQGSTNNGWATVFGSNAGNIYFMPAYTSDPRGLGQYNIQAEVNWGSAWPEGGNEINLDRDNWFISQLNPTGKKYIPTVSPLFATHMSYKNFIWRGDNWLLAKKYEQIISLRGTVDQLQLVSWNDYGESTYIGPIGGDMPPDVRYYVNDRFPHEDILSLVNFYSIAWKTGRWPAITKDQIWVMARPHARYGSYGGYGVPSGRDFTQDNFYAQVHLTADATVTLCAGACSTQQGKAGINRFSQPLQAGQGISVEVRRNGQVTARISPNFTFQANSDRSNFNYLIKSS